MKKQNIERKPEKFYYWKFGDAYRYQINYNVGFSEVGFAENIEKIKEKEKELNLKSEKID